MNRPYVGVGGVRLEPAPHVPSFMRWAKAGERRSQIFSKILNFKLAYMESRLYIIGMDEAVKVSSRGAFRGIFDTP